jgi:hypothetical protein
MCLVPARCRLARLQLIQVPPADCQVTAVFVHALAEAVDVLRAHARRLVVHLRGVGVGSVVVLRSGLCGRGGPTAKEAADCVADGGADSDSAIEDV